MRLHTPLELKVLPTVVIADDESSMRLLVHATIEPDDYNVLEASDGTEAWAMVKEHRPALVLLDVQMPGRSGLDVLRLIKADPTLEATRVILLTAKGSTADKAKGLDLGADDYLTKPFEEHELELAIRNAFEKQRLQDEVRTWGRWVVVHPNIIAQPERITR